MIPRKITARPKRPGDRKREKLVVGRAFCRLALSDSALVNQMTAVDITHVVHHAHIGWRQARVRDTVLCGLVLGCAVLAPFGTVVWLLLSASLLMLPRMWKRWRRHRRRLAGLFALTVITVISVIAHGGDEARSLLTPLAVPVGCLVVYFADAVVSWYQIRRIPRSLGREPASRFRAGPLHTGLAAAKSAASENVVVYERDRIVGAGGAFGKHTLTVPIDEPEKDETVQPFLASDLLHFIAGHIRDQGVADSITHALPDLQVGEVLARPIRLMHDTPRRIEATQLRGTQMNPPSGSAERVYVRAQATSWGGELVGTIFVSVALEGRFLRLVVLPYVLGPIAPELRVADAILRRDLATHLLISSVIAARELWLAVHIARARAVALAARLKRKAPQQPEFTFEEERPKTKTIRERYSVDTSDDLHQTEDGVRIIQVMEQRVFTVTKTFLKQHGIATQQFEQQVNQVLNSYVIIGSNNNMTAAPNSQAGNNNTGMAPQSPGAN
jgi:hypothetical protein